MFPQGIQGGYGSKTPPNPGITLTNLGRGARKMSHLATSP